MINDSPHQKEALKKALSGLPAADQTATATFHLAPSASPAETEQLVKNVTTRVSNELGRGGLDQVYIKGNDGYVILMSVGDEAVLTTLVREGAKLGLIFLDMRRTADDLEKLV